MQVLLLSAILACGQASRLGLPDTTSAQVMPFYGRGGRNRGFREVGAGEGPISRQGQQRDSSR